MNIVATTNTSRQEQISTWLPGIELLNEPAFSAISGATLPHPLIRQIMATDTWEKSTAKIPLILGRRDSTGKSIIMDLASTPHLLIAGGVDNGKAMAREAILVSLLYRFPPEELRLILVDSQVGDFLAYQQLPHLITPVISDMKKAPLALNWLCHEMDRRYDVFARVGVRNFAEFNARAPDNPPVMDDKGNPIPAKLPYIVIIIDELADFMKAARADAEIALARIAQTARASGIHAVVATQSPNVTVLTGIIKANFPNRLAFKVASPMDSRTIIERKGAETLSDRGEMFFLPSSCGKFERAQCVYVAEAEVARVVATWAAHREQKFYPGFFDVPPADTANDIPEKTFQTLNTAEQALVQKVVDYIHDTGNTDTASILRHLGATDENTMAVMRCLERKGFIGPATCDSIRKTIVEAEGGLTVVFKSRLSELRSRSVLKAIEEVWEAHPNLRLGQLLINAARSEGNPIVCPELFYMEDEALLQHLGRFETQNAPPPDFRSAQLLIDAD